MDGAHAARFLDLLQAEIQRCGQTGEESGVRSGDMLYGVLPLPPVSTARNKLMRNDPYTYDTAIGGRVNKIVGIETVVAKIVHKCFVCRKIFRSEESIAR